VLVYFFRTLIRELNLESQRSPTVERWLSRFTREELLSF